MYTGGHTNQLTDLPLHPSTQWIMEKRVDIDAKKALIVLDIGAFQKISPISKEKGGMYYATLCKSSLENPEKAFVTNATKSGSTKDRIEITFNDDEYNIRTLKFGSLDQGVVTSICDYINEIIERKRKMLNRGVRYNSSISLSRCWPSLFTDSHFFFYIHAYLYVYVCVASLDSNSGFNHVPSRADLFHTFEEACIRRDALSNIL